MFQYVLEELNVRSLVTCNDTLKYASLRAEPDFRYVNEDLQERFSVYSSCVHVKLYFDVCFSVLGKRLGKSMGVVAKEVKAMSQENILAFERDGEVTIAGHCLKLSDIKVLIFCCLDTIGLYNLSLYLCVKFGCTLV